MPTLPVEAVAALIAVSIVSALFAAVFAGRWLGVRRQRVEAADDPHIGVVQGAILALLGLLVGFSFSGASERFVQRQDLIVREASAIGTAYVRCDLLPGDPATALRQSLRDYLSARIELFDAAARDPGAAAEPRRRIAEQHARMWKIASGAVQSSPQFAALVIAPINEIMDLYAVRTAATRRHIPMLVMGIMIACAMASLGSVGYVMGLSKRRFRGPVVLLVLLVSAALWVTIDLDFARHGLIQIDDLPLRELRASMNTQPVAER